MSQDEIKELFHRALAIPREDRPAFLARECGDSSDLQREIEDLLADHDAAGSFLAEPTAGGLSGSGRTDPVSGTVIGPYKLVEEIGAGGFGVVYVAEQTEPVRRQVALKVVKAGMDTREVVSRFEAERQALALMDHPHIARVFDGGTTPGGRPYFVMELVKGIPIQEYCDQCQLPVSERLALFVQVCNAVQHAHQKGIIHRDIKPSNVLVSIQDGKPAPKVIDFGVAKATGVRLTDATFHTRFAQMIGTPLYMSPEQAEMSALDVDTRSDIYSLGVLLYELLTGTTPFTRKRMVDAAFDELRRIIREEDPPTPSVRLTSLNGREADAAAARRTDPRSLIRLVHGDLDWIVMKALEKDRQRRYETASSLAADVERHLQNEPVEARPPSTWYRATRFARRHRAGVTITALAVAFFALATGAVGWMAGDRTARQAALDASIAGVLEQAGIALELGRLAEAREAVQHAEGLAAAGGASDYSERALGGWRRDVEMMVRLKKAHLARGLWNGASPDSSPADLAYREAFRWYGLDVLTLDPAEALARMDRSTIRDGLVAGLDDWLTCCRTSTRKDPLRALLDRADLDPWRRRCREALRTGDKEILRKLSARSIQLGLGFHVQGKYDEAIAALLKSIELDPQRIGAYHALGRVLQSVGRLEQAVETFRASRHVDPSDPWPLLNLGHALRAQGSFEEAVAAYHAALDAMPEAEGVWTYIGLALVGQGEFERAVAACRKTADRHPKRASAHSNLGFALLAHGDPERAVAACTKAIDLDSGHEAAFVTLAGARLARGDFEQAVAAGRRAIELGAIEPPEYMSPFHPWYLGRDRLAESSVHSRLAWVFATVPVPALRDPARAIELAKQAVQLGPQVANNWTALGAAQWYAGEPAEAKRALTESVRLHERGGEPYDWLFLAMANAKLDRKEEAKTWLAKAIRWMAEHRPKDAQMDRFRSEAETLLAE